MGQFFFNLGGKKKAEFAVCLKQYENSSYKVNKAMHDYEKVAQDHVFRTMGKVQGHDGKNKKTLSLNARRREDREREQAQAKKAVCVLSFVYLYSSAMML